MSSERDDSWRRKGYGIQSYVRRKFSSSWLREDVEGTEEERERRNEEVKKMESKSGNREVEREEEETVIKRKCVNPFCGDTFEACSPVEE